MDDISKDRVQTSIISTGDAIISRSSTSPYIPRNQKTMQVSHVSAITSKTGTQVLTFFVLLLMGHGVILESWVGTCFGSTFSVANETFSTFHTIMVTMAQH
eukprot:5360617-Amphidinium_carterae.3